MKKQSKTSRRGQSLMELLVGMAVGAVLVIGSATIIASSLQENGQVTNIQIQAQLGESLLNNTKAWAQGNWNALLALATGTANDYALNTASSPFTVVPATSTTSGSSTTYLYSRSITVGSNASGTNTNFPMLFSGTYSWLEASSSGGRIQNVVTAPNGSQEPADLIFTSDAGCSTPLNFESESYTSSTGAINDWVNVPSLSAGTVIYACYGASSVTTDQSHPSATWNSNYKLVYHFPNGTSLSANDSTANGLNGTLQGSPTASTGQIGGSAHFVSGSSQYISASSPGSLSTFTASAWVKRSGTQGSGSSLPGIFTDVYSSGVVNFDLNFANPVTDADPNNVFGGFYDGSWHFVESASPLTDGAWSFVTVTYDGSTVTLYVNNNTPVTLGYSGTPSTGGSGIRIGRRWDNPEYVNGDIDEVQLQQGARSASWILTEYNNQNSPFTFYTVGSEVSSSSGSSVGYSYSRSITVGSNASGTNTNFPMLFSGTYSWLEASSSGGRIQNVVTAPNGSQEPADFVFATSTANCGVSNLNFETEKYTSSTGAIVDWINVPSLSAGTAIYACYGASSVTTDQSHPSSTWNSNYIAVYHFPNGSSLNLNDSTANGNTMTNNGLAAASGEADGAAYASAGNNYAYVSSPTALPTGNNARTLEMWVNLNNDNNGRDIFGYGSNSYNEARWVMGWSGGGSTPECVETENGGQCISATLDGNWHFWAFTLPSAGTGSQTQGYLDGQAESLTYNSGNPNTDNQNITLNTTPGAIGAQGSSEYVDEARISNVQLSPSWILTEYNNQNSPSTFYAVGSETSSGSGGSSAIDQTINNGVTYQSYFYVNDVYRDSNGNVTTTISGNFYDPSTKLITASVSVVSSTIPAKTYSMYLTRNGANNFTQQSWSGGSGFTTPKTFVSSTYAAATDTTITTSGGLQLSASSGTGGPFANGYSYSRSITVGSNASGTSTNFPMLISGTYSYLAASSSGGYVQNANGDDIIFTSDSAGNTKLNWEIESYTSSTGNIVAWVNVPTLASSTKIYEFYDNSSTNAFQGNVTGTWNSNYLLVWHLPNGTTLNTNDSTANGNNGTNSGSTATTGEIDGGGSFDGSTSYITTGLLNLTANNNTFSASAWFKTTGDGVVWGDANTLFTSTPSSWNPIIYVGTDGYLHGGTFNGSAPALSGSTTVNDGAWHYATVVQNSTTQYLYLDGTQIASSANGTNQSYYYTMGSSYSQSWGPTNGTYFYFPGSIDEGRILNAALSPSWILTEYNNQNSPSTFYTVGSQSTGGGGGGTPTQVQTIQLDGSGYNYGETGTFPTSTTTGDTIIVAWSGQNTGGSTYVTDPTNGTYYVAATTTDADGIDESDIFYMPNAASVNFVTINNPYVSWHGEVYEYSGLKASAPLDQTAINAGAPYYPVYTWSDPLTTTVSGDLLIGVGMMPDPVALNSSTNYSIDWYPNGPTGWGPIFASGVAGSPGSYPFAGTSNDWGRLALAAASFESGTATQSSATGTLDSQPFDTRMTSGAQLNSFIWQGTQPSGTTVKFQFAGSNSSSGPWNFVGPDGTNNTYFSGNPGTPVNLVSTTNGYTLFNGYRYFSYRTFLYTTSTAVTPVINGVTVNWSP